MPDNQTAAELFEELKDARKTVEIDGQTYWIVEGDLGLDEDELMAYAHQRTALRAAREGGVDMERKGLVGILEDNRVVRWAKGLVLTYAVLKDTFASEEDYDLVVAATAEATGDWEHVCGVDFEHKSEWDDGAGPAGQQPLFLILGYDSGGDFIAMSFFPYHPEYRRRIYLDPVFFQDIGYDKVGILRHELGHMLGWRHEHIRSGAPAVCPDEVLDGTIAWGEYDPQSVMHYFCGGMGTREMEISDLDAQYARAIYGPPDHEVKYFT